MRIRFKPLLGGLATKVAPSLAATFGQRNQPRVTADYYYTVWLRHVSMAALHDCWNAPASVLEIGPGRTLGAGLAALLSGTQKYLAFDASALLTPVEDAPLLQALATLFRQRLPFAERDRILTSTTFPGELFPGERLAESLSDQRLARIRQSVQQRNDLIAYWNDAAAVPDGSVEFLFSHSVLEHVEPLEAMYRTMWRWLKPGGVMTHSIDFSSHGTSPFWNGHWTIPNWVWRLMQGKRRYFLNRAPASTHRALLEQQGFEIKGFHSLSRVSVLQPDDLAAQFQSLSATDLTTEAAFVVARKPL